MMNEFSPARYFDLSRFKHRAIFTDCNKVWEVLQHIESYLRSLDLGKIEIQIPEGVHLVNKELISIGKGTVIEPGVYIKGPCVIGENCTIRHGAYIRGNFLCGNNCVIGHTTEVKNSLFLDHVQAAHFAYVGDSILGNKTNLGAGTKCANLRLDNSSVRFFYSRSYVDTGLRKFGAVFGDYVQTGCNSVTNPGTILGKRACIYPCAAVHGVVPEDHMVKNNGSIVPLHHTSL